MFTNKTTPLTIQAIVRLLLRGFLGCRTETKSIRVLCGASTILNGASKTERDNLNFDSFDSFSTLLELQYSKVCRGNRDIFRFLRVDSCRKCVTCNHHCKHHAWFKNQVREKNQTRLLEVFRFPTGTVVGITTKLVKELESVLPNKRGKQ